MIRHDVNGLRYYSFESIDADAVTHGCFTRLGGASVGRFASFNLGGTNGDNPAAVKQNHISLFRAIERKDETRFDVWQVHGTTIVFSEKPRPPEEKHKPADGIFTQNPDVTLVMRFADCVPLVFYNPVQKVVGLVHAGWMGSLHQIARVAVECAGAHYGCKAEDWVVGLGPSICGQCYQVGEDVRRQFLKVWGDSCLPFFNENDQGLWLDLWGVNEHLLRQAGVRQIENSRFCTAENLDEWYSYRAEKGYTGRFGVVIALRHANTHSI